MTNNRTSQIEFSQENNSWKLSLYENGKLKDNLLLKTRDMAVQYAFGWMNKIGKHAA